MERRSYNSGADADDPSLVRGIEWVEYARIVPGSGDRPANPGPYRRDPPIPARQAAFGKPTKYRALSCPPGGPYDCQ